MKIPTDFEKKGQKGVKKWVKNGSKMGQKWVKNDPFLTPLLSKSWVLKPQKW